MACNPALGQTPWGLAPAPFPGEEFLLHRADVDFQADGMARYQLGVQDTCSLRRGVLYLSDVRLVFVAPPTAAGPVSAFDMPLLFVRNEAFVQPLLYANYLALKVFSVALGPDAAPHYVTLSFKEGGAGTFLPLFESALAMVRGASSAARQPQDATAAEVELRELRSSALVDPSDPTTVFLPASDNAFDCDATANVPEAYPVGLRRRPATIRAVEE
jgi:hypothetical protein